MKKFFPVGKVFQCGDFLAQEKESAQVNHLMAAAVIPAVVGVFANNPDLSGRSIIYAKSEVEA